MNMTQGAMMVLGDGVDDLYSHWHVTRQSSDFGAFQNPEPEHGTHHICCLFATPFTVILGCTLH